MNTQRPQAEQTCCRDSVSRPARRGVLLLVVVSMLTLFLLLGTTYLVAASRARQAARAHARLAFEMQRANPASLLDAVLLNVVRGGPNGVNRPIPGTTATGTFESLLADRYGGTGSSVLATATAITEIATTPLLEITLSLSGIEAAQLPGRVLSLLPLNGQPTSHRISSAVKDGSAFRLVVDNPPRKNPFVIPKRPVQAVVNGLEFDGTSGNEPYDGFDDDNVFLARIEPADASNPSARESVAGSVVKKIGFVTPGADATVIGQASGFVGGLASGADNDNDGTADGFFLDFGLPAVPAPDGTGTMRFDASVLVVDLDSRFNVNAHGSLTSLAYPRDAYGWPIPGGNPDIPTLENTPLGSGYGPAEVNTAWMFPQASYPTEASRRMTGAKEVADEYGDRKPFPAAALQPAPFLLSGAAKTAQLVQKRPKTSRFQSESAMPAITDAEGRYGEGESSSRIASSGTSIPSQQTKAADWSTIAAGFPLARPGKPEANDTLSLLRDTRLGLTGSNSLTGAPSGIPALWWSGSNNFNWSPSSSENPRGSYNSPPDLHGRMLTTTATASEIVPRLIFAKPEWGGGETTDDPYDIRLDPKAARAGILITSGASWDNLYGYSDLEAVLRPYDGDSAQLPKRLVNVLGPASEEARLRVTTDSWDTTLITGTAARKLRDFLASGTGTVTGTTAVTGLVANEVARGERLNLNRPLSAAKPATYNAASPYYLQRQALFKDLFLLLVALGAPSDSETAQWAANVVEFQDADSTITPFEYDAQCGDSPREWKIDGDVTTDTDEEKARRGVVWGAERPEIVIREAFAWKNSGPPIATSGLVLSLHRPWNATAFGSVSGSSTSVPGEPCDFALDTNDGTGAAPPNRIDLGKKPAAAYDDIAPELLPIWRLRITAGGTTQYVRFDTGTASGNQYVISPAISDGNGKPKLGVDSTLTITSTASIDTGTPPSRSSAAITISGSSIVVPNLKVTASGTAYLERLSDPAYPLTASGTIPGKSTAATGQDVWDGDEAKIRAANTTTVPIRYIVVDSCRLEPVETSTAVTGTSAARNADAAARAFWRSPAAIDSSSPRYTITPGGATTPAMPAALSGANTAWFVWPNRPLVSAAELFLVPKRSAQLMLEQYEKPTASSNDLISLGVPDLLDAVHVPSRFGGIHVTVNASGAAALANNGFFPDISPVEQISSSREPGRVNINTVVSTDVWNALVAGPLQVSGTASPLVASGTAGANFATAPAKSMLKLLALSSTGSAPMADSFLGDAPLMDSMRAAKLRNPLHELYTATRLANTATIRSNVFGIWITVRAVIDDDPDTVQLHRGFYIVDRSIPVAHEPGKDNNVWDCVVLRRIIE